MYNMKKSKLKGSEVRQVGRFGLVGIMNTVIDFLVLNILAVTLLPKSLNLLNFNLFGIEIVITGLVAAGLISGTLAMINSYIFNMRFTFKKRDIDTRHSVYFFLITILGLYAIRPVILKLLTDTWLWPSQVVYSITSSLHLPFSSNFDQRNFALLVAIAIVLVYNYLTYKFIVFKDEKK